MSMLDNKQQTTGNTASEEGDGQCGLPPYDPTNHNLAKFAELARPWRERHPPSSFYKKGYDPLGRVKQQAHYIPLYAIVSPERAIELRRKMIIWIDNNTKNGILKCHEAIEELTAIMLAFLKETCDTAWTHRKDPAIRPLFRTHWRIAKEDLKLAIKLRFKGALTELQKLSKCNTCTNEQIRILFENLWWVGNIRQE